MVPKLIGGMGGEKAERGQRRAGEGEGERLRVATVLSQRKRAVMSTPGRSPMRSGLR